jgi:hypothetical protein
VFDPETIQKALAQVERLNENLETLHKDAKMIEEARADLRRMTSTLRDAGDKFRAFPVVARQLAIMNQILLQVRKSEGAVAMVSKLFEAITGLRVR